MSRALLVAALLLFIGVAIGHAQPVPAPSRTALLILNSEYQKLPRLDAPRLDGALLSGALRKTGFQVQTFENYNLEKLATAFDKDFIARIKPGDQVLVFFSGYAVQENENFLLPVNFDPQVKQPLGSRALSLTRVQQDLEDSKASIKIILIDGARNENLLLPVGTGPGLTGPDQSASAETAFLFAAPLNTTVAADPKVAGKLATLFSKLIQQRGSDLLGTCSSVQRELAAEGGGRPFFGNTVTQTFYFTAPEPVVAPQPVDIFTKVPKVNRTDRQAYVFIAKGSFDMGCVPSPRKQDQCEDVEKPQHRVTLTKNFWIGETEVTRDAYARFAAADKLRKMPKAPFWTKEMSHPVTDVSWDDASAFCGWVGGRLPYEAEWEYAARGGKSEVNPLSGDDARDKANFMGQKGNDRYPYTAPVKTFDPNPYGLFDMAGNVWEWTADWFSPTYYRESPGSDPAGPATGKERVARGGSFMSDPAKHLRISFREKYQPAGLDRVGFRCVLPDSPETRSRFAQ